jgi:hypothetical protein
MQIPIIRFTLIVVGTAAYFSLAVLGWGGLAAFFSHPALIALAVAVFVMAGVSFFAGGNLSPGVREDRGNRWVLIAFSLLGLLDAYLPAYTDRKELWTIDGDTTRWLGVVLFIAGGALRLWPVFVLANGSAGWSPSSPDIPWSPAVFMVSSAIPAIWGYSSTRWVGAWPFVRESACCSRRSLYCRSSRASVRKRGCCALSLVTSTMPTVPGHQGWFPGCINESREFRSGSTSHFRPDCFTDC